MRDGATRGNVGSLSASSDKQRLRQRLRLARSRRSAEQDAAASAEIATRLRTDPLFVAARSIAAFVGVTGEPDTRPVLEAALADGKTLWLPRVLDGRRGLTELVAVTSLDVLQPRAFGLLEPGSIAGERTTTAITAELGVDLVLVPGLAFGRDGARLGHGPGHYDRLLAPVRDADPPRRWGVCFDDFVDPSGAAIPIEAHDVPMHAIVTERATIACR